MILNLIILILFGLMVVAVLQYKKSGNGKPLVLGSAGLMVLTILISFFVPNTPSQVDLRGWNVALGEVVGQQTSLLIPKGGKTLVFVMSKQGLNEAEGLGKCQKEILDGLKNGLSKNVTITLHEIKTPSPDDYGDLTSEDFAEGLRANPDAEAVINFPIVIVRMTSSDLLNQLPKDLPKPKLILGGLLRPLAEATVKSKIVDIAILERGTSSELQEAPKGKSARQIFDERYELLTASEGGQ